MHGLRPYPDAYEDCLVVQKLKEGIRDLLVVDKDSTIQKFPHPVAEPSHSEVSAGLRIRKILEEYPVVFSSAQTPELGWSSTLYARSVEYGFDRPPPKIKLPDGSYTSKPEEVRGWEYLRDPDAFIGLGTGIYPRKNGGYKYDRDFEEALGGRLWRPQLFNYLDFVYPDKSYQRHLSPVDRGDPEADVAPLPFRVEFRHSEEEARARDELYLRVTQAQLEGRFTTNMAFVDESNPAKRRYTTYMVPHYGLKDLALERFGSQVSVHAGVPMEELCVTKIGDSPTDLASGLRAFQGAKEVRLIVAAKSRISECILANVDFAGIPLAGCPNHAELPGRYFETETPGVLWWHGAQGERPRQVILAEYAPWSKGLECTESVLACLEHLGFGH